LENPEIAVENRNFSTFSTGLSTGLFHKKFSENKKVGKHNIFRQVSTKFHFPACGGFAIRGKRG
jgi:hypothetical protein